ncbi:MAG: PfkB family carbohydrate kinase [Dehalococcoidia bacterium]
MTLLVTGWVAIDEIETPFAKVEDSLGGSATAAALGAALFTDVRLLAAVGEDFPERHRKPFDGRRIDLSGLITMPGGVTSRWGGRYHYDLNTRDTLFTELGVNAAWDPPLPPGWEDSQSVFFAAGDPVVQLRMRTEMRNCRSMMVDTIKFYMDTVPEELRKTMAAADFISINDSEARELADTASIARAGRKLLQGGVGGVIIKLGEFGAAYVSGEDYFVAPGFPLEEVIDPTGAGDAFAGGFMGYLDSVKNVTTSEIRRAMIYGSTVASFQVEGFGPSRLLTLTREEVEARYRQFRQMTHFEVDG